MAAYADNIAIIARTKENLRNHFGKLEKSTENNGFIISDSKTKLMRIARTTGTQ